MLGGWNFSFGRLLGIVRKEVTQLKRDRLTFAMIFGIPLFQLVLFGYVVNSDPRFMDTTLLMADDGPQARRILYALKNSDYFNFTTLAPTEAVATRRLATGLTTFVITIPPNFSRDLVRGDRPTLLMEADASDPIATQGGINQLRRIVQASMTGDLTGGLAHLAPKELPVEIVVHPLFNPEADQKYNIVPGLMGIILTLTMVMITALSITRESERGTMENLLSMPTRPSEVLIGKMTPYVIIGYIQVGLILLAARFIFHVPILGSIPLLLIAAFLFIVANLALGITFSTTAKNQLQALQMSIFMYLPTILLSGFLFPFRGMPRWAQYVGEILPITHFLRISRGIMLKGNGWEEVRGELWPIAVFTVIMMTFAIKRYRQTLD